MAEAITLIIVALLSGYIGSKWQKSRQATITKSEATALRLRIKEAEKSTAYLMDLFEDHQDVHRVLNHHMNTLAHNMDVAGRVIGLKQSGESRFIN